LECEADALSDGEHVYIPSVMEHVELAGVHSGDSACIIPPETITEANSLQASVAKINLFIFMTERSSGRRRRPT
ncbi:hypothetical protein, partial [Fibrobacter sp. HC4]|uniref:hypothetical protein n=1 Tax=Fibrobacter sp. HC4 TaxID=3239812 RepID=UPI00201928CC